MKNEKQVDLERKQITFRTLKKKRKYLQETNKKKQLFLE